MTSRAVILGKHKVGWTNTSSHTRYSSPYNTSPHYKGQQNKLDLSRASLSGPAQFALSGDLNVSKPRFGAQGFPGYREREAHAECLNVVLRTDLIKHQSSLGQVSN